MRIVESVLEMQRACRDLRLAPPGSAPSRLGLVPTMGALHAGHLSLVARARAECDTVAATIFVNPLQFGPNEDFARYPRQIEADSAALETAGVDLLFLPTAEEMYPGGAATTIDAGPVAERLDGRSRPGHFRGVATVVAKLFHIVGPDRAYFGQKDAAQVAVLRRMAADLNFPLKLVACPIVRDADGLALSSRNQYLSPSERESALILSRTLAHVEREIREGERQADVLLQEARTFFAQEEGAELEYLEAVDALTLEPVQSVAEGTLIAIAAKVGRTRLIDNLLAP